MNAAERPTIRLTREDYLAQTPPFPADKSEGAVVRLVYTDAAAMAALPQCLFPVTNPDDSEAV